MECCTSLGSYVGDPGREAHQQGTSAPERAPGAHYRAGERTDNAPAEHQERTSRAPSRHHVAREGTAERGVRPPARGARRCWCQSRGLLVWRTRGGCARLVVHNMGARTVAALMRAHPLGHGRQRRRRPARVLAGHWPPKVGSGADVGPARRPRGRAPDTRLPAPARLRPRGARIQPVPTATTHVWAPQAARWQARGPPTRRSPVGPVLVDRRVLADAAGPKLWPVASSPMQGLIELHTVGSGSRARAIAAVSSVGSHGLPRRDSVGRDDKQASTVCSQRLVLRVPTRLYSGHEDGNLGA